MHPYLRRGNKAESKGLLNKLLVVLQQCVLGLVSLDMFYHLGDAMVTITLRSVHPPSENSCLINLLSVEPNIKFTRIARECLKLGSFCAVLNLRASCSAICLDLSA